MKKFYYLFAVLAFSLFAGFQAYADTVTKTMVELAGNPSSGSVDFEGKTFNLNSDVTLSFSKGTGSTNPQYYVSGAAMRFYGGNTAVFKGADGVTISKIEFKVPSSNALSATNVTVTPGSMTGTTWSGSANEMTMTNPATKGNVRFTEVTITYSKASVNPDPDPQPDPDAPVLTITDVLDEVSMGLDGSTTYKEYKNIKVGSNAVYYAQCSNGNNSIQLRTTKSTEGVVSQVSGGRVEKITVEWNSNTNAARVLNVYGNNTAYADAADLFGANAGTKATSLAIADATNGVSEYTFTDAYKFIGFRSNSGAMYLSKVKIAWRAEVFNGVLPGQPVFSEPAGRVMKGTKISLSSPYDQAVEIYYTTDGTEPSTTSTKYTEPIEITGDMTIKAIIAYQGYKTAVASQAYTIMPEYKSLAEVNKLAKGAEFIFDAPVTVVYVYDRNVYIYDGANYSMFYKSNLGLEAGDSIAAGFQCKMDVYQNLPEIIPGDLTVVGKANVMPQPTVVDAANAKAAFSKDNVNGYFTFKDVRFTESTPATKVNYNGYVTVEGKETPDTLNMRNNFLVASTGAGKYDVTGFMGVFKTDYQFYVTGYEECLAHLAWSNIITPATLALDGEEYKEYTATFADGMAFLANTAAQNKGIALRNTDDSGIVATASTAEAASVTVYWNDSTKAGIVFDVYGSNKPYAATGDLMYNAKQGRYLGSLRHNATDTVSTLALVEPFKYVGFRVNNGAAYVDSIKVEYTMTLRDGDALPYKPAISLEGGNVKVGSKVEITSPVEGLEIRYTTDGTQPGAASALYAEPLVVDSCLDLQAVLIYSGYMGETASAKYTPAAATLAEANEVAEGSKFVYDADLTVVYAYGEETANAYVYDGANYGLLSAEMTVKAGSVVSKGWTGTMDANLHMVADSVKIAATEGTLPEPRTIEVWNDSVTVNEYVLVKNVTFASATPAEAEAFDGKDEKGTVVDFYNMFELAGKDAATYNVTGFIALNEENDPVVYPTSIDTPAGIAGIEAEEAEAVYYDLQGIRVSNPEKGRIYIRITGKTAEKVLVK